jgi:hypothetical protein
MEESFLWMTLTYANPQGGMDEVDRLPFAV